MAKLVVGRFDNIDAVQRVLDALPRAGFARAEFGTFYSTPPGQHQLYPIGGDAYSDEGARHAGQGAAAGCAVGLAVGAPRTSSP